MRTIRPRPFATYPPANYRIDGRAPQAQPNDLEMTAPHDFSGFDNFFHPQPKVAPAAPVTAQAAAPTRTAAKVATAKAPASSADSIQGPPAPISAKAAMSSGNFRAAPNDVNGSVVQGLLDKAAGVKTPVATPVNPGAVARATGQQQQTPYGTVGTGKAVATSDGAPLMENGVQVGIQGNPQQGPAAPTLDQSRAVTLAQYPDIGRAGTPENPSPQNAAFVAYAKQHGEAAAHQNLDSIMKPFQVGPPTPTQSDQAAMAYAQRQADEQQRALAEGEEQENTEAATADRSLAKQAADKKTASDTRAQAADAQEKARLFTPGSVGSTAENAVRAVPSIPSRVAEAATSAGQGIENFVGYPTGSNATAPASQLQSMPGRGKEIARRMGLTTPDLGRQNVTPDQLSGREDFANLSTIPKPAAPTPAQPSLYAPKATPAAPAPPAASSPAPALVNASPTPGLDAQSANQHMQSNSTLQGPPAPSQDTIQQKVDRLNALTDNQLEANGNAETASNDTPNYARGHIPNRRLLMVGKKVPNYADGSTVGGGGDNIDLADNMRRANSVQNVMHHPQQDVSAPSFDPQPSGRGPTAAQNAEAASWAGDMRAANAAIAGDDKAAGITNQGTMDEQLAGPNGPMAKVQGNPPNYAAGHAPNYVGIYAKGKMPGKLQQLFGPAMQREKTAIKRGTGGAKPSDRPVPINLPGAGPAVVNTGEQVVPTPAGAAVLNRKMLSIASGGMIKPSHRGRLHRALNVPLGEKIPAARIATARRSPSPALRKMAVFAQNFGH